MTYIAVYVLGWLGLIYIVSMRTGLDTAHNRYHGKQCFTEDQVDLYPLVCVCICMSVHACEGVLISHDTGV